MMFIAIWALSVIAFFTLSLGMARFRKLLKLPSLNVKQERGYLYSGLLILIGSLTITFMIFPNAIAMPIWCGILSLSALTTVSYLTFKFNRKSYAINTIRNK